MIFQSDRLLIPQDSAQSLPTSFAKPSCLFQADKVMFTALPSLCFAYTFSQSFSRSSSILMGNRLQAFLCDCIAHALSHFILK